MQPLYNPLQKEYKSICGGVREKQTIRFCVHAFASEVYMYIYADNERIERLMAKNNNEFSLEIALDRGLYFYCFCIDGVIYGMGKDYNLAECDSRYQLTVYPIDYQTPDWIKGNIIYQIFPDRFCKKGDFEVSTGQVKREDWGGLPTFRSPDGKVRNNEFFGGNFKGIQSKINFIKRLGVGAIYLNPISKSYSSHRYDTGDYIVPDPVLGSISDFKELIGHSKKKEIYFILDGVFNHTGAGSVYFNKYNEYDSVGAFNDKNSPYYNWYTFYEYPCAYASWWGFKTLPAIKKDSKEFQKFIAGEGGVIDEWLTWGVRGVRLDVVDELKDFFVAKIRRAVKKSGDNLLIGEVWEDATNKIAYGERRKYFTEGELDSVMNYPLRDAIINFLFTKNNAYLKSVVYQQLNNYPKIALDCLMNVLSTHDSVRIITLLGSTNLQTDKDLMAEDKLTRYEYNNGRELEKIASVLQYFLYGVPSVYYGDEAGLEGNLDPYNRRCYDWNGIDADLLKHYKKLGAIRRKRKVFKSGETKILPSDDNLLIFTRGEGRFAVTVAVNLGRRTKSLKFNSDHRDLYSGRVGKSLDLYANSFLIICRAHNKKQPQ